MELCTNNLYPLVRLLTSIFISKFSDICRRMCIENVRIFDDQMTGSSITTTHPFKDKAHMALFFELLFGTSGVSYRSLTSIFSRPSPVWLFSIPEMKIKYKIGAFWWYEGCKMSFTVGTGWYQILRVPEMLQTVEKKTRQAHQF